MARPSANTAFAIWGACIIALIALLNYLSSVGVHI